MPRLQDGPAIHSRKLARFLQCLLASIVECDPDVIPPRLVHGLNFPIPIPDGFFREKARKMAVGIGISFAIMRSKNLSMIKWL